MARAYLSALRAAGIRPERVLQLVWARHAVTRKPLVPWLPGGARLHYSLWYQAAAYNFWPRKLHATAPHLVRAIQREIRRLVKDPEATISELIGHFDYRAYAGTVDRLFVDSLGDGALVNALQELAPATVLFTGGGIVPPQILGIQGIRVLHVHPGHLPYVRGGDGLLWSVLLRGCPGASVFFMAEGIDTGDIIEAVDFPSVSFDLAGTIRPSDEMLYRALYSFYDPLVRAKLLVDVLERTGSDFARIESVRQNLADGVTFHFMHSELRRRALERLFPPSSE